MLKLFSLLGGLLKYFSQLVNNIAYTSVWVSFLTSVNQKKKNLKITKWHYICTNNSLLLIWRTREDGQRSSMDIIIFSFVFCVIISSKMSGFVLPIRKGKRVLRWTKKTFTVIDDLDMRNNGFIKKIWETMIKS